MNETGEDDAALPPSMRNCPVCDAAPIVLIAIRHPTMRAWTDELLRSEHGCWTVVQPTPDEMLVDAIGRTRPQLVVVDSLDFPACCRDALDALPRERVIVVGPEPDPAYRSLALGQGAGGWVGRDHIGEQLSVVMRTSLGCTHAPCPGTSVTPAISAPQAFRAVGPAT